MGTYEIGFYIPGNRNEVVYMSIVSRHIQIAELYNLALYLNDIISSIRF